MLDNKRHTDSIIMNLQGKYKCEETLFGNKKLILLQSFKLVINICMKLAEMEF